MTNQAQSANSFRERLAYALYRSAVAVGLENDRLSYETQIDDYLRLADALLDHLIPLRDQHAHSFDLPVRSPRHSHSDRG